MCYHATLVIFGSLKIFYSKQGSYPCSQAIVLLGMPKGTSPNVDDITGCTAMFEIEVCN